ncbi:uncharacterized protein [Paramisgurnus dabryanus]|uniref:uncharacterized protein n=1 Tax=Paramisgurnus dabryanus TaxID=90735 RepID=UPI003CCF2766
MGALNLNPRVQTSVPTPAPSPWPGQDDHHKRPGKSPSPHPGVVRPPGQGCHRASRSPIAPRGVPHADHCRGSTYNCQRRVVYVSRPEGCLLPHPYSSTPSAVSAVCLSRAPFPVPSAPIRSLPLPSGVHQVCDRSPFALAVAGHEDSPISGRLAHLCAIPVSSGTGHVVSSLPCGPPGPPGEFYKELPGSIAGHAFSRYDSRCNHHEGSPITTAGGRHPPPPPPVSGGQAVTLCGVFAPPREADGCRYRDSSRTAVAASPPEVVARLSSRCPVAPTQETQGVTSLPSCSGPMESKVISPAGHALGFHCISSGNPHNRCFSLGVGCCVAESNNSGAVVCPGALTAHQCSGTAGCAQGIAGLSSLPGRPACACAIRQCLNCVSHKPPRRHQVCTAAAGVPGPPAVGRATPGQPEGDVFAWGAESGGRLTLPLQASAGRVAASSGCGPQHLGHLRQGRGGSLCLRGIDPLPPLVLLDGEEQPSGPGCSRTRLARGSPLCFSTNPSDSSNTAESPPAGSQATVGSPLLAGKNMVSTVVQSLQRFTVAPPRQEGSPVSVTGPNLASRSSSPAAVGLVTAGPDPLLTECSDGVCNTILNARAPSTRAQYENRWQLFTTWCSDRDVDPVHCSVPKILEFLQSLLDGGRSPATLRVYVAAISSRHARVDNDTVGCHRLVSLFLKGAWRLRPPRAQRAPAWDLHLVLDSLCSPPFEPLAQAELKWVSIKTAFLLAITSAKRVGELHALSVSNSCLRWNSDGSGVTLWPNTAFLPKVLSSSNLNQPIHLAQFTPPEGEDRLQRLCPVRALKTYVVATASIRQSDQLFLCYGGPRRGCALSKQRLSHWVVDVITQAYKRGGHPLPSGVRCHSTRAVSTSWAALRGVPLERICEAASWASPSTFSRFYRVNVATPHPLEVVLLPDSVLSSQ